MTGVPDLPLYRDCPTCQAKAGDSCTQPTDNVRRVVTWFHSARIGGIEE